MDVRVGDILVMKKNHPCGENKFLVLRSGMDFKLRCTGCGHEVMVARVRQRKISGRSAGRKGKAAAKRADQNRRENDGIKDLRRMKRCLNS